MVFTCMRASVMVFRVHVLVIFREMTVKMADLVSQAEMEKLVQKVPLGLLVLQETTV